MPEIISEKPTFDFEAHKRKATEEYRRKAALYGDFAQEVRDILADALASRNIRVSAIQFRAKTLDSFGKKAATPSDRNPSEPKYPFPMADIKDLAGARVITFFPRTVFQVCACIRDEFEVVESVDHTLSALQEERLGYQSVHLLVRLEKNRTRLPEYRKFDGLIAEIQVRTIMQHAWAEIEHDIRYKSATAIPTVISRRFMTLAGLLEIADREFQAIQDEDAEIRSNARNLISENRLEEVELTPDALQAYLDMRLGPDERISDYTYEWVTRILREIGFQNLRQVDACIAGLDDDKLCRLVHGGRQGQIIRFEVLLLAAMGENYPLNHPWKNYDWFKTLTDEWLKRLREGGAVIGSYLPKRDDR